MSSPRFRLHAFALVALLPLACVAHAQTATNDQPSLGTFQNGVYHHYLTGVEFTLPPDWTIASQGHASSSGQGVQIRDTATNLLGIVWLRARHANPDDIPALLEAHVDAKLKERINFEGYKYRTGSLQHAAINGKPSISVIADYTRAGQKMVEYMTWIDGEQSRVVFVCRIPAAKLPDFQPRFDTVIQSAVVP